METDPTVTMSAADLPVGATFDAQTGIFLWTPTFLDAGSYGPSFTATDDGDGGSCHSETTNSNGMLWIRSHDQVSWQRSDTFSSLPPVLPHLVCCLTLHFAGCAESSPRMACQTPSKPDPGPQYILVFFPLLRYPFRLP